MSVAGLWVTLDEGNNWCTVCEKQLEKPVRISEEKTIVKLIYM